MKYRYYFLFVIIFAGCSGKDDSSPAINKFFDLKEFARNETTRLNSANPSIEKTVSQNGKAETKTIKLSDWESEFEFISESDINKPAFADSYSTIKDGNSISYLATDPKLKTRELHVLLTTQGTLQKLHIKNRIDNFLYSSTQDIQYIPDSVYTIERKQNVIILGSSNFSVRSKFKN